MRFLKPKQSRTNISMTKNVLPMATMTVITGIVLFLIIYCRNYSANNQPGNVSPFVVVNDEELLAAAMSVRQKLFQVHKGTISKLNFAILMLNQVGSWSLASYNGHEMSNASQCVYLPYLTAGVNWCISLNKDPHCLQMASGPMISSLSSIHAGIVVDTISSAPNANFSTDASFDTWLSKRHYTMSFLNSFGLLGNQTILNKIYPSNSGPQAIWAEYYATQQDGNNYMDPYDSAMLMLYVTHGGIVPTGQSYITDLISRQTFSQYTSLGFGVPPGSILHTVMGTTTTDINEISHIVLPNGREIIIAAFSDAYQNNGFPPYQSSMLGMFAEGIMQTMNLTVGNPTTIIMDTSDIAFSTWNTGTNVQAYNNTYLWVNGSGNGGGNFNMVEWSLTINTTGLYEICVWFPAGSNHSNATTYVVDTGDQTHDLKYPYIINQVHYGARWIKLDSFYLVA
eukprot:gene19073-22838_t